MITDVRKSYSILGLEYNSNASSIKKAYHKLALKYHPDRCDPGDPEAVKNFNEIKKAYEVLIKFQKEETNRNKTASEVSQPKESSPTQQPPPNEFELALTLEEMLTGCTKNQTIKRLVTTDSNSSEKAENAILKVTIKAGSVPGTRVKLSQQGDKIFNQIPADVIFIVKEKPCEKSLFKLSRDKKYNVEYIANITSKEAVLGVDKLEIPTLEKDTVTISVKGIITVDTFYKILNRGLPFGEGKRGELIVKFNILYEAQQEPAIEHNLFIPLHQIVSGVLKKVKITRRITNDKNIETKEDDVLSVEIKAGTLNGTKITFSRKGHTKFGTVPSDVIFTVLYAKSEFGLSVIGNTQDIEYIAKISNKQFLNGDKISIPSLDKQNITFFLDSLSSPSAVKKFSKRGLPFVDEPTKRGNLIVKFQLVNDLKPTPTSFVKKHEEAKQRQQNIDIPPKPKHILLQTKVPQIPSSKLNIEKYENMFKTNNEVNKVELLKPETLPKPKINITNPFLEQLTKPEATLKNDYKVLDNINQNSTFQQLKTQFSLTTPILPPKPMPRNRISKVDVPQKVSKDPPVFHNLFLTLENVLKGCNRQVQIRRKIFSINNEQTYEDKLIKINVKPGTVSETKFSFPECGNVKPGTIPSDVVFIAKDKPHDLFTRQNENIVYSVTINEKDAFDENIIQIPTLEKNEIPFTLNKHIKDNSTWLIPNCGLPFANNPNKRGNLIIKFTVIKNLNISFKNLNLKPKIPELPQQDPPIETTIPLTLKDIFYGRLLEQKIKRRILTPNGQKEDQEKSILINIKPGCLPGTRFRFPKEGNHLIPGRLPADLVFVTTDKVHPVFKRKGNSNIEYTVLVTASEAESGIELEIPRLEGGGKWFTKTQFKISDGLLKSLPDQGLPKVNEERSRGAFCICFEVVDNTLKDPDIEQTLELTLEEWKKGCSQCFEYERQYYDLEGNIHFEKKSVELKVGPKINVPTMFRFPRIGVTERGRIPADLTVLVKKEKSTSALKKRFSSQISSFSVPSSSRNFSHWPSHLKK